MTSNSGISQELSFSMKRFIEKHGKYSCNRSIGLPHSATHTRLVCESVLEK